MKNGGERVNVWAVPLLLGLASVGGLLSALFFDGVGDLVSWLLLGLPVYVGVFYAVRSG